MSIIALAYGEWQATINTTGAWLEALNHQDQPVLFPKQSFALPDGSTKVRGGCHVCLPNFGPGGSSGQTQHGFGREFNWQIAQKTPDLAELGLAVTSGAYKGLNTTLRYALDDNGLQVTMSIQNNSDDTLGISPGLHPYFTHGGAEAQIDNKKYPMDSLQEALFIDYVPSTITTTAGTFAISSKGLPQWVLWTDRLADYVCLEPSYAGFGFEKGGEAILQLQPGHAWRGSLTIMLQ